MTPRDFTPEVLINWGGTDVFKLAVLIADENPGIRAEWDPERHVVSGIIPQSSGYDMRVSFDVQSGGAVVSHCPCPVNQVHGRICAHVVALGLRLMQQMKPPEPKPVRAPEFPPAALRTKEAPVNVALMAEYLEDEGKFELYPVADLPIPHILSQDRYFVQGTRGYVLANGRWFPIQRVLQGPFQQVYAKDQFISREAMPSFIRNNLPVLRRQVEVRMSPSEDLFRFQPDTPVIHLMLHGSRAAISVEITAHYGTAKIRCGEPAGPDAVCRPDPDDMLFYHTRNLAAEEAALQLLRVYGFERQAPLRPGGPPSNRYYIDEPRDVLNFLGGGVPFLRRQGWRIGFSSRLEPLMDSFHMITPVVKVTDGPNGSFDIKCTYDTGRFSISSAEIQQAINRGDAYVKSGGETLLIDADAVKAMRGVFSDCASQGGARPGEFRVKGIYAPFVRASLQDLDAVDLDEENAPSWRETAQAHYRDTSAKYEPVDIGPLETVLRPYQKQGVYWMRFLEKSGLSGLLADEMGLGKTLQTLTWLSLERLDPAARKKPALIVCPTSLVRNWEAEAARFTPSLKRLVLAGPDRAKAFAAIPKADLVITSYALLQRDLDNAYADKTFSVVVLDEAQHIKNRSTRNARSAKRLNAVRKLVLTGTPVENSVADVWSIFDFLLPGYLGDYEAFKSSMEDPIAAGGPDGRAAQVKLHHKLHPFILRRLKKDVAKDLPDKIERVVYCPMTEEQQRWYNRLLSDVRGRIGVMVKAKGFAKSKFEILALLMRLRQVASHVGLLKEYRERAADSAGTALSGKIDAFFELLDEAIDGGHRVLVFSQFVSMLTILRRELEARGIRYCYLDGSTKNRLGECRTFNTDETIPLFLISLHAGGTGLNLTGADMVVHFDPWWNPAVEAQATDRAHRIGQKRTVYVVKMIAEHSVEERVLALQRKKQLVIDATVGTTDEQAMDKLTYDDIKSIVGL